ncbi:hypothetical protein JQK87_17640 [Streptomyces sp. G44]|uniref:hypothetical protein n=1 Tax=Streptomyces sp. G44 TaxID=2807632 RepID=UPI00196098B8|nr:hypothetical protein [Streptomyces sp. G44]MBM7170191.1 hypothetical protein [Streptomyces sp. G44]
MREQLYPDLMELGGLQQALTHAARQKGKQVGAVEGATSPSLEDPNSAKLLSRRGSVMIYLGAEERRFYISTANVQHSWMEGVTDDFADVVDVVLAWQSGVTLRDLHSRFRSWSTTNSRRHTRMATRWRPNGTPSCVTTRSPTTCP